jgi:redox-sensing transcriptional repressor
MKLPKKTVQRLSLYRRLLFKYRYLDEPHIFSHDLARMLQLNPVQVRRDLMLIGSTGNHRKGYNINELIKLIGKNIDFENSKNIIVVGMGKLGMALTDYLSDAEMFQKIIGVFDIDPAKVGSEISGIRCYDIMDLSYVIAMNKVSTAVLTVPPDYANSITEILIDSGINGILNYTSVRLSVPKNIHIQDFDIITALEELVYSTNYPDTESN